MSQEKTCKAIDYLSEDQMREYGEVFQLFKQEKEDKTHMTRQKLSDAMRMLGLNPKEEEIQEIINTIDIEGGGRVEFENFITMMEKQRVPDESEALNQAYCVFDADHRGFIESADLRYVMEFMKLDKDLKEPDLDLQEMFNYLGIDVDRRIPYDEFKTFISANIDLQDVEDHGRTERTEEDEESGTSKQQEAQEEHEMVDETHPETNNNGREEPGPSKRNFSPTHFLTSTV